MREAAPVKKKYALPVHCGGLSDFVFQFPCQASFGFCKSNGFYFRNVSA
jgi:hypothetical protein